MYHLAKYPEKQQRLVEELESKISTSIIIDAEAAAKLPYLQAVVQEALRILPPVSFGGPRISPGAMVDGQYIPPNVRNLFHIFTVVIGTDHGYRQKSLHRLWL